MPVSAGPLTLYYPKWVPGLHEPAGPVGNVAGLKFTANGKPIPWRRDLRDIYAFRVELPAGARQLVIDFDYLEPSSGGGPAAGSATDKLLVLNWNQVLLYPAGLSSARVMVTPRIQLPEGWKSATALDVAEQAGSTVAYKPVTLERLVDSTLIAGEYFRAVDVTPPGEPIHHEVDMVADSAGALAMSPEVQQGLTRVVAETGKLFGALSPVSVSAGAQRSHAALRHRAP
jgi:predicted metalloprotease with PDZ domain